MSHEAANDIVKELNIFRNADNSMSFRDAMAMIATIMLDSDQRIRFVEQDGTTTIVDHLQRLLEEQREIQIPFQSTETFGFLFDAEDIEDYLLFAVMSIAHGSFYKKFSIEAFDQGCISLLMEITTMVKKNEIIHVCYEAIRNLYFEEANAAKPPQTLIETLWKHVFNLGQIQLATLSLDILCNLAGHDPKSVEATDECIKKLVSNFVSVDDEAYKLAAADVLTNFARDGNYALLLIYDLDEVKPPEFRRHSGIVYVMQTSETLSNETLKRSLNTFANNLAWTDDNCKVKVLKLEVCDYMDRFGSQRYLD